MRWLLSFLVLALTLVTPARADRYWLGPVTWYPAAAGVAAHYGPPANVTGWIDLRTLTECGTPGTAKSGVGLFVTADLTNLGADYRNLGLSLNAPIDATEALALKSRLRLATAPTSATLRGVLLEALTTLADSAGTTAAKPILPTHEGRFEIWLAGQKIVDRVFDPQSVEGGAIQKALQQQYRELRDATLAGKLPKDHYLRVLDFWMGEYRQPAAWFIPADLPVEEPIPHGTTVNETWPTNSTTISSGQDNAWTEVVGDMEVSANKLRIVSGTAADGRARCDVDLSSSNNYAQLVISSANTSTIRYCGPACRYSSSADSAYLARQFGDTTTGIYRPAKLVTGTITNLGTGTTQTSNATKKIEANGTSITIYSGGSSTESITDSSLSTGTRVGIVFNAPNTAWYADDFVGGDLATVKATLPFYYHQNEP